jgi:hypothetical protein
MERGSQFRQGKKSIEQKNVEHHSTAWKDAGTEQES